MSCPDYNSSVFYLTNLVKDFGDISFPIIKYMNDASLLVDCFYCRFLQAFDSLNCFSTLFKLLVYCFECFDPPILLTSKGFERATWRSAPWRAFFLGVSSRRFGLGLLMPEFLPHNPNDCPCSGSIARVVENQPIATIANWANPPV